MHYKRMQILVSVKLCCIKKKNGKKNGKYILEQECVKLKKKFKKYITSKKKINFGRCRYMKGETETTETGEL